MGTCYNHENLVIMDKLECELNKIPGVTMIFSPLMLCKVVNMMFHEGNIRYTEFPKTKRDLGLILGTAGSRDDIAFTACCSRGTNKA